MDLWTELLRAQGLTVFVLGCVLTAGGFIFQAKVKEMIRDKADASDVKTLTTRVGEIEDELVRIRSTLEHLPTSDDLRRIELGFAEQRGDLRALGVQMNGLGELMKGQSRRLDLIDEHLQRAS